MVQITVDGKELYTPCQAEDDGAIRMSWKNVPKNQLKEPKCETEDVHAALAKVKPSVSQEDIDKAREWTEMFGKSYTTALHAATTAPEKGTDAPANTLAPYC